MRHFVRQAFVWPYLLVTAMVVALVIAGVALITVTTGNHTDANQANVATAQLCVFVDNEHNKDRATIVTAEIELYRPPPTQPASFHRFIEPFIDTAAERRGLNLENAKHYLAIRGTRPLYCSFRKNPVAPYPAAEAFREGRVVVTPERRIVVRP